MAIRSETARRQAVVRPRWTRQRLREHVDAYIFLAPWLIGFLVFTAGPMIGSLALALTDWDLINAPKFIGLRNFPEIVHDDLFWKVLANTAYYTIIGVPIHLFCALLAALALNQRLRWVNYYRTMVYLPSVTPAVASAFLWQWIFNPDFGLANAALVALGLPRSMWIWDPATVKPSLIFMGIRASGRKWSSCSLAYRTSPSSCWRRQGWMALGHGHVFGTLPYHCCPRWSSTR